LVALKFLPEGKSSGLPEARELAAEVELSLWPGNGGTKLRLVSMGNSKVEVEKLGFYRECVRIGRCGVEPHQRAASGRVRRGMKRIG
jgi:hypothetical protein